MLLRGDTGKDAVGGSPSFCVLSCLKATPSPGNDSMQRGPRGHTPITLRQLTARDPLAPACKSSALCLEAERVLGWGEPVKEVGMRNAKNLREAAQT